MATTTSIIVLLKFFAGRQNSAAVDFNEFCEYLRKYSDHHLEEQPVLVTYLSDTATQLQKELDKLVENRQVILLTPAPDKKVIIVIPYFTETFQNRYKEIKVTPQIPFPQESDIPKKIPNEVVTRKSAAELINTLLNGETLNDKTLWSVVLPHDVPAILLPSIVSIHTLIECAVLKLRTMLAKDEHHDYFLKKLTVSNPGKEMTAKNIFNRFVQTPDAGVVMIKQPEDSFYFLTQLLFFIRQDYEKVKDVTAEDLAILQSVYILEIAANYFKNKAQESNKKEGALKNLEQLLRHPPYYFTFNDITRFTSSSGVPLLGLYGEEDLKDFLHRKTTESSGNELPELLVFKTDDDTRYFIYKNRVMPLVMRLCTDARMIIRETIKKNWQHVLRNFDDLPEMKDQAEFEKRLEKEVRIQSPILYSLLNTSFLLLINYESSNEDNSTLDGPRLSLFENGQLIPYSDILLMNRSQLLTDTKILLPFWYTVPVISWILKMIMKPPKSKKQKSQKTSAQIYHEKEAENSRQDNQEAALTQNPAVSRKVALREAARNLENELIPQSSTLDRELHSYEHQWNKLIGKVTHNNLTEDVNTLIKDYLRKVLRTMKSEGFTKERIESLAESLVKTPGMQKIGEEDALMMYVQLYIIKLVKNIPM